MISKELTDAIVRECAKLIRDGRPDAACTLLSALAKLVPASVPVQLSLGVAHSLNNDRVEAVAAFRKILQLEPQHADAQVCLAAELAKLGQIEEAEQELRSLIRAEPGHPGANFLLANVLYERKQYAASIAILDRMAAENQLPAEGWGVRAAVLEAISRPEAAIASWQKALDLNPGNAQTHQRLGNILQGPDCPLGFTVLVQGGVGDFLQCLPFLFQARAQSLAVLVVTHFPDTEAFFQRLHIKVDEILHFSSLEELQNIRAKLGSRRGMLTCPRTWYFRESPFPRKKIEFGNSRPVIAVHLGGSAFSLKMQKQMALVPKSLPLEVLRSLVSVDRFNLILFGSPQEIQGVAMEESDCLRLACFADIGDSLAVTTQCNGFVGSDSAIKSMTAMMKIPSVVWLGNYQDYYRDAMFVNPYVDAGLMKVFRYKDISNELDNGIRFTLDALAAFGLS